MLAMFSLGILEMVMILSVLAVMGVMLLLVVLALAGKHRAAVACLVGIGIMVLLVVSAIGIGTIRVTHVPTARAPDAGEIYYPAEHVTSLGDNHGTFSSVSHHHERYFGWGVNWLTLLLLGAAILVLLAAMGHRSDGSWVRRAGWPLLGVLALGFFYFGGSSRHERRVEGINTYPSLMDRLPPEVRRARERAHQIAGMDLVTLMEQADAPKIKLKPVPPIAQSAPPAPTEPLPAPDAEASHSEPADSEDKAQSVDEGQSAQESAESEPTEPSEPAPPAAQNAEPEAPDDASETSDAKPTDEPATADSENVEVAGTDEQPPATEEQHEQAQPAQHAATSSSTDTVAEQSAADDTVAGAPHQAPEEETSKTQPLRPQWIDDPPRRTGETRREVVVVGPYATIDECYRAADIHLLLKTYQRLQELLGRPFDDAAVGSLEHSTVHYSNNRISGAQLIDSPDRMRDFRFYHLSRMGIGVDYVRRELVAMDHETHEPREFVETVDRSFGPMKQLYMQIEFTPAIDQDLLRRWENVEREKRFWVVGGSAGGILALLGSVLGLIKLDTWTRGYYSKWLFLGLPAAIIGGALFVTLWFSL